MNWLGRSGSSPIGVCFGRGSVWGSAARFFPWNPLVDARWRAVFGGIWWVSAMAPLADMRAPVAELPSLTQSVNREFFGMDRFDLVSPPYPGLETIRNQTLPRAITD